VHTKSRKAVVAALTIFLAACGSPGSTTTGQSSPSSSASTKPAASAPLTSDSSSKPAVNAESASPISAKPSAGTASIPSSVSKPAASDQAGQLKLTMASASLSAAFSIPWIADATGGFSKHGVTVTRPFMDQTSAALAALVAGDVDAMDVSAPPVITANANGHLDLVYVAAIMNHAQFSLVVSPNIKTASDLKGRVLATEQEFFPNDYGMKIALSKLGVKESDVQLRRIGGAPQEWAAMSAKQVEGGILTPPFAFIAEKAGFHTLVDTFDVPYQNVGIVMPRNKIDAHMAALVPTLLAIREAMQTYNQQPDAAMKVISDRTKETDPDILKRTYDFYKTQATWETSLQPTLPGIQGMIDFLAGATPSVKDTKPEQYVDLRALAQMPKG